MLRQVLLLQRDVPKATKFYQEGLGLRVKVLTERWAELDAGSTTLALKAVEGCVTLLGNHMLWRTNIFGLTGRMCMLIFTGRLTALQDTHLSYLSASQTCNKLLATCCSWEEH